jgi:hypothetical protein
MKNAIKFSIYILFMVAASFASCKKKDSAGYASGGAPPPPPPPPPPAATLPCAGRPIIDAKLVHFGNLSEARIGMVSATAGSKIAFAGGMVPYAYSSRVDIYDTITHQWSIAALSVTERQGMVAASVGSKIFFAGGGDHDWGSVTSRVDIYDVANNSWSTAELSQARDYLAAVTVGNKIYFAGGGTWGPITGGVPVSGWPPNGNYYIGSDVVDIYDNSTNSWSSIRLSEGRFELSATVANDKIYFAGGLKNIFTSSDRIDIYDLTTNSWNTSYLLQPKTSHASIAVGNKIFWASGARSPFWYGYQLSDNVEVKDLSSNVSTVTCIIPRTGFQAVMKNDKIIFFTGGLVNDAWSGIYFEIYDVNSGQWSTALLNRKINDATIISVNNNIYVAGGREQFNGAYSNEVWKLEF